jgi:hypothetical protein
MPTSNMITNLSTNTNREFIIKNDSNQTQQDISINNNQQQQLDQSQSTTVISNNNNSNGLVRRLSVTARPGDIFYKVKDVTETATTDTLTHESNNNNINNSDVNDYAEIDNFNDDEEKEIIIKPINGESEEKLSSDNDLPSPTLSNNSTTINATESNRNSFQTNGTNNKKITSWKVNRHQTTSLGINQSNNENQTKAVNSPKDDIALNTKFHNNNLSDQIVNNNVEPGSPQFTKELLSIR